MPTLADIRTRFPEYSDIDDNTLATKLHSKFYSDMAFNDFAGKIGLSEPVAEEPAYEQPQLIAGKEPGRIGRFIGRARDYVTEKTGLFAPNISVIGGPKYREEQMLKTIGQVGLRHGAETLSGLGLRIPDILANKITGEDTLAQALDKLTGFTPDPRDVRGGEFAKFMGELKTLGRSVGLLTAKIPARAALKTMLSVGLTFGTRATNEGIAKKIISDEPINWQGIHFESGVGVLFGAGEVGIIALAKFIKGFKTLSGTQIRPAREEVNAALKHYKTTGDRTAWDAVRQKYAGITPAGVERIRARTAPPPKIKGFGKYPLAKATAVPTTPVRAVVPVQKAVTRPEGAKVPIKAEKVQEGKVYEKTLYRGESDAGSLDEPSVKGTHYTTDISNARTYAEDFGTEGSGKIIEKKVRLENPYISPAGETQGDLLRKYAQKEMENAHKQGLSHEEVSQMGYDTLQEKLQKAGYDGIVEQWESGKQKGEDVVVFQAQPPKVAPKEVQVPPKGKGKVTPKIDRRKAGFVDLTPIAEAGEQIAKKSLKAHKVVTRFTGLEAKVRKALIEVEEQERQIPKIAAKESIKKFGKLSNKDSRVILNHLDNPKKFPTVPEHLKAQVEQVRKDQKEVRTILKDLGYGANWPAGRITYLREKLSTTTDPEKQANIKDALQELAGLDYVHHAYKISAIGTAKRIVKGVLPGRKISKRPSGLLGRKYPTLEAAEKAGKKVAHLSVGHAEMLAIAQKAKLHNELIEAINKNKELAITEKKAPEDWVYLDPRVFPASQSKRAFVDKQNKPRIATTRFKYQPAVAEAIEELTYVSKKNPLTRVYDKINATLKHILFYNPIVMTKNDMFQGWRATGLGFVAKMPKALASVVKQDAQYEEFRKAGLYNNVIDYVPAANALAEDMLAVIQKSKGRRMAEFIGKRLVNPTNILKDLKFLNDKTTWNIDEVLRTAVAMDLSKGTIFGSFQKRTGLTRFETIELANDFLANYGKVPKQTRQIMNRAFFTPTYRVSMARMFAKMWAKPKRFWPQLLRHYAYKLFVWYVLPGLTGMWVYGDWKAGRSEKGYKVVLRNPRTGKETVYSLSDPLLEEAKLTQRPILQSFEYNLAAVPNLIIGLLRKPKFRNKRDKYGHLFKLGTPIFRDVVNMTDKDKTTAEKILTELAIAYVYKRRAGPENEDTAIEAFAKAISIWTDWKAQKKDIQKRFE